MSSDHDHFAKRIFGRLPEARTLLTAALPTLLLKELDLDTLVLVGSGLIDKELSVRYTDLLFSVMRGSERVLVYALIEHKGYFDPATPRQIHSYMARAWEEFERVDGGSHPTPRIFPVLLYHGEKRLDPEWYFRDVYSTGDESMTAAVPGELDFKIDVLDLGACSDTTLLSLKEAGTALAALSLLVMRHIRNEALLELLVLWDPLCREVAQAVGGEGEFESVVYYATTQALRRQSLEEVRDTMSKLAGSKVGEVAKSLRDYGREEGLVESLLLTIRAKFGDGADEWESRVQDAGDDQIRAWLVRAATAETIAAVFETG